MASHDAMTGLRGAREQVANLLVADYDGVPAQMHRTEQRLGRNVAYQGKLSHLSEDQAREALSELLSYFGPLPCPPSGLPGRNGKVDGAAYWMLCMGRSYLQAVVDGRHGRQWQEHELAKQAVDLAYSVGRADAEAQADAIAARLAEEGEAQRDLNQTAAMVYFIASEDGPIKIGMAVDPLRRLKGLQTSHHARLSMLATCAGGARQERAYHQRFAVHRLHGEWFARCPEIEAEIARLTTPAREDRGA